MMTAVYPMKYIGGGVFHCLRPKSLMVQPGEICGWQIVEHRSPESHRHFFALVHEAWVNLPERLADDFPNSESLRKWALIKAGYCSETRIVCANNDEALRLVATAKSMDQYALVAVNDKVVTIWRANSQAKTAQGRAEFQSAKEAAMHHISVLIGADVAEVAA